MTAPSLPDIWAKDCTCIVHTGPHWLYADALWRAKNQVILDDLKRAAAKVETQADYDRVLGLQQAFAIEDGARCREKIYQMRARGIELIPPATAARAEQEVRDAPRVYLQHQLVEAREQIEVWQARADAAAREHDNAEGARRAQLLAQMNGALAEVGRGRAEVARLERLLTTLDGEQPRSAA